MARGWVLSDADADDADVRMKLVVGGLGLLCRPAGLGGARRRGLGFSIKGGEGGPDKGSLGEGREGPWGHKQPLVGHRAGKVRGGNGY